MVYVAIMSHSSYIVREILGNRYMSWIYGLFFSSSFFIVSLCVSSLLRICIGFFFPHPLFILPLLSSSLHLFYSLFISSLSCVVS